MSVIETEMKDLELEMRPPRTETYARRLLVWLAKLGVCSQWKIIRRADFPLRLYYTPLLLCYELKIVFASLFSAFFIYMNPLEKVGYPTIIYILH